MKKNTYSSFLILIISIFGSLTAAKKPNVLFIVCDDLNTHVSTSDYEAIKTPSFDRLANEGLVFKRTYCQYPVCGPSRASFLSGMYPESTGILDNRVDIREERPNTVNMPAHFRANGYWTGGVGKIFHNDKTNPQEVWDEYHFFQNDELPMVTPIREKFEKEHGPVTNGKNRKKWKEIYKNIAPQTMGQKPGWGPTGLRDEQHRDGKNARQAASWLKEKSYGDKPFMICVGIHKPHIPFIAPKAYFDLYPTDQLKVKPASLSFWEQAPEIAKTHRYKGFGFDYGVKDMPLRKEFIQAYHACVSYIDAQIGLVLDAVKESGEADNTIIVLTSDHGYLLGEKFMWGKVFLYDLGIRVPLIIKAPGHTVAGTSSESLTELLDIFPTLTDLCEIETPSDVQGSSLVPVMKNPEKELKDVAYTVVRRKGGLGRTIIDKQWHYAVWPDETEELYDISIDAEELVNLASSAKHKKILKKMRKKLKKVQKKAEAKKS